MSASEAASSTEAAAAILATRALFDVFRHGHQEIRNLKVAAESIAEQPAVAKWLNVGDIDKGDYGPERMARELLEALLENPPLYGGWDALRPELRRAFKSKDEIQAAAERLQAIPEELTD